MTLVEVFVVIVIVGLFALMFFGVPDHSKARACRVQCLNNLKQIGVAARVWEGDNGNTYPWQTPGTNGGTMDFVTGPNAWRHFQVMSNELSTPKILLCPVDDDQHTTQATNFANLSNSYISYFVGIDACETNAMMLLSGDHNLTNGTPVRNGLLQLTTNDSSGWTAGMHNKVGNIAKADGSVQAVSSSGLRTIVENTGVATNRLQMPILGP